MDQRHRQQRCAFDRNDTMTLPAVRRCLPEPKRDFLLAPLFYNERRRPEMDGLDVLEH